MSKGMAVPTHAKPCTIDSMPPAVPMVRHHATPARATRIPTMASVARRSRAL
ncbi:hypothetical protein GFS60_07885 (plasmid) [Rhodococcus sp. WAY2]|nr:hypothetical protein GFS60_07885 [Rhodococcus sp. WAY2]